MTVEELKAEAENQGYKLVKVASPIRNPHFRYLELRIL